MSDYKGELGMGTEERGVGVRVALVDGLVRVRLVGLTSEEERAVAYLVPEDAQETGRWLIELGALADAERSEGGGGV